MLSVFLLDAHDIPRAGARAVLQGHPDITILGEAKTVADGAHLIPACLPDVVLIDAHVDDGGGLELCTLLRTTAPTVRCLVLTAHDHDDLVVPAIQAGASGCLPKSVTGATLVGAVRAAAEGHSLIDPETARRVIRWMEQGSDRPEQFSGLSEKQLVILGLLAEGLTNKEIGERIFLAEKTVKNNVTRILATLGVQRRTQAALIASRVLRR